MVLFDRKKLANEQKKTVNLQTNLQTNSNSLHFTIVRVNGVKMLECSLSNNFLHRTRKRFSILLAQLNDCSLLFLEYDKGIYHITCTN